MKFLKGLLWPLAILGAIGGLLYAFLFDYWLIPADDAQASVSILPTLAPGDLVLVSRNKGEPAFGHLVRCSDPDDPTRFVVGRVVGFPGEIVTIEDEVLSIDHQRELSRGLCHPSTRTVVDPKNGLEVELTCQREDFGGMTHEVLRGKHRVEEKRETTVETGKIFLLSDNVHMHQDSRDFGPIEPATCQHVVYRLWGRGGLADKSSRFTFIW